MSDNLDKYVPEFDEEEARSKLAGLPQQRLTDMLVYEYKLKRVIVKMLDAESKKLQRIEEIIAEPGTLPSMPGVPSAEDLRRMMGEE